MTIKLFWDIYTSINNNNMHIFLCVVTTKL